MNHLIIYCHPNKGSFCHALLEVISSELTASGDNVIIRDLYRDRFDSALEASEFLLMYDGLFSEDVSREHEYIKLSDTITFIYPVWWSFMPAMLKGYIDRVFCNGFAYRATDTGVEPLFADRKTLIVTTKGNSNSTFAQSGLDAASKLIFSKSILEFCGIKSIRYLDFDRVPSSTNGERLEMLSTTRDTVAWLRNRHTMI